MSKILGCVLVLVLLLLGGGVLLTWDVDSSSVCSACFSLARGTQWRLGDGEDFGLPLTRLRRTLQPSPLFVEQMGSTCAHDFQVLSTISHRIVGDSPTKGAIWSGFEWSTLGELYDKDPDFRRFILEKERIGDLKASDFVAAVQTPDHVRQAPSGRHRDLYELAECLMGEYDEAQSAP